ncbi:MAG: chemotaxis-specific protein-glutamate methyltransferase CheB [Deltaproteobacteria bacterium]|nr:chemotaxis-specific protein-glutamate methyltransferase CheB [Deltaproteobacteria bacterium]
MTIRVLIVEDSAVVAELLNYILGSDPAIRVVGTARDGWQALQAVRDLKPDVITMDINMPGMGGYEATCRIMETHPAPIVIVSVSIDPREVATTFRALEAGALAAVQKPMGIGHPEHEEAVRTLIRTVKLMSEVKVVRRWPIRHKQGHLPSPAPGYVFESGMGDIDVIALGASTGGPSVLQLILSGLPKDMNAAVFIVQHISPGFVHGFAESLAPSCKLPVHVPEHGEPVLPGHVYLAPDGVHMGVGKGGRIGLVSAPPMDGMRPSISFLFRSVADVFGRKAIGVLLTGMGRDGADGLKAMKEKGAVTIAQDEESCVIFGMPAEAIRLGAATHVLSPEKITAALVKLVSAVNR